jgi:hypothetical protein
MSLIWFPSYQDPCLPSWPNAFNASLYCLVYLKPWLRSPTSLPDIINGCSLHFRSMKFFEFCFIFTYSVISSQLVPVNDSPQIKNFPSHQVYHCRVGEDKWADLLMRFLGGSVQIEFWIWKFNSMQFKSRVL